MTKTRTFIGSGLLAAILLLLGFGMFCVKPTPPPSPVTVTPSVIATASPEPTAYGPLVADETVTPTPSPTMPVAGSGGLLGTCHVRGPLPDAACTPGVADPRVTQENIHSTICVSGYTSKVRPPVDFTNRLKQQQMQAYGYSNINPRDVEEDHLLPLEAGGAPQDARNLWPELWTGPLGAHTKDAVENKLKAAICSGRMPLAEGQLKMMTDWVALCRELKADPKCE